ncbi:hypothetical protein COO60DRAFT_1635413 [Scenedesmus sp. NREL 46B-D3]|nr:hypothetical protein COO60DRAFT_1635413 [Scenedesmus sp. NREL 46B-D3]
MDMEEIMAGMSAEPPGCVSSGCNTACPAGTTATYSTQCSAGATGTQSRCCPGDSYPEVLLLVDRGTGQPTSFLVDNVTHADYSYLRNEFPPDGNRKYMLVFWDHGSGWSGYGLDHTCTSTSTYSHAWGCNMLTLQALAQGLDAGLNVPDPITGGRLKLDIIGFDACLMAMYEVGSTLAPYGRYLLASELLEPGHGWDYAALAGITQRKTAAGVPVASVSAVDVGDLFIDTYFRQAAIMTTSGLTLAVLDLATVGGQLESSMRDLSTYFTTQMNSSPAFAIQVLRRRAALGTIAGAEENVDLGALLASFSSAPFVLPNGVSQESLSDLLSPASAVYRESVKSFRRDAELPDGSGMTIYFPKSGDGLAADYSKLVSFDSAALAEWKGFLDMLYMQTSKYTANQAEFKFVDKSAVNFLAVSSNSWITHGTLTTYVGLTANLLYGFRYLFGLVQDFAKGDDAVDGLALAYADEQRVTNSSGHVTQLILQVKVYYAPSCYAATADMKRGTVKYVYDTRTQASTTQLFVSGTGGSWGEVPPGQGGVVIPYLASYDLVATEGATNRFGVSFGYSDCLKWGYDNSIQLAAFDAVQAADILGLDLARDMETQLLVKSIDGVAVTIPGYFTPAQKTLAGCQCSQRWTYSGTNETVRGTCINPLGDPKGAWCNYEPDSCTNKTGLDFDYCQVTTVNGCYCRNSWSYGGVTYGGTCRRGLRAGKGLPGFSADTPWCYVESGCTGAGYLEGQRFDVCTPEGGRVTESGQACKLPASYGGVAMYDCVSYNQSSNTNSSQPWCFSNATSGEWGYCAPWSCSAALKQHCPRADPSAAGANLSAWSDTGCLESLCNARQALANVSQCTKDSVEDRALLNSTYRFLASSTQFGAVLQPSTGHGTLPSYCDATFGQLCVDELEDPACPALYRTDNRWYITSQQSLLCDMTCLTMLCRMQEKAKAEVKGTPQWQSAAAASRGFQAQGAVCADAPLENLVRWTLMEEMDKTCGWSVPSNLACNRLLSPPQLCAANTLLTQPAGNITDGVQQGGFYSSSSSCTWTVNLPDMPYITLRFSKFDTEAMYDVVTVEDFDGVIGMFSGKELPSSLTTDTGLIKLRFTSDSSLDGRGFAASYLASTAPQVKLPVCTGTAKLVQVVLRTRQFGSELSWLITRRVGVSSIDAPNQLNIAMAGGLLPSSVKSKVPAAVIADSDTEYKDYRSYYKYMCLPLGFYNLNMYDSFGDGWDSGRITEDAATSSAACSLLTSNSAKAPYYMEAGLVLRGEDTNTFNLAKQRKIKEALALLMDVDAAQAAAAGSSSQPAAADSIHQMLQQEQQHGPGMMAEEQQSGAGDRRRQLLAKVAVPVHSLLGAAAVPSTQAPLAALEQHQDAEVPAEAGEPKQATGVHQQQLCTAAHASDSSTGQAAASDCPAPAGFVAAAHANRQLQQLLVLDQQGDWQQPSDPAADAAPGISGIITAALAAQPLEHSTPGRDSTQPAATNSLAALLRPVPPTAAIKPVFTRGARRPSKVALTTSFRNAFKPKQPGTSSAHGDGVFWASSSDHDGMTVAAVPKPGAVSGSQAAAAPTTGPAAEPAGAEEDEELPGDTGFTAFDALRPARSLMEVGVKAHSSSSQGPRSSSSTHAEAAGGGTGRASRTASSTTTPSSDPGYAAAAAGFMEFGQALVANGTLRNTLAAGGWTGTDIGLSYTSTGMLPGPWTKSSLQNLIIGVAAAGGGALLVVLGVLLYVRRVRSRAAAQVPRTGRNGASYTATGTSFSPASRPSMVSGYTTGANARYVSSSDPSASYGAAPSSPSPVLPFHPQTYMQQGRSRSSSASPPAANANPFASGGFGGSQPQQQQHHPAAGGPAGSRSQPWADGMRRGASYSTVQQQPQQWQQQQQQPAYYGQADQPVVDPVYPFVRTQAASFSSGQQGPGWSGSPARLH